MAAFGMQNQMEGFGSENTQIFGRTGSWNVDMTSPGDSKFASKGNARLPAEFGSQFELYDPSQEQQSLNRFETNMQCQMQAMMQMMNRFMQYMEALLQAEMANQLGKWGNAGDSNSGGSANGNGASSGTGGDGGSVHHCHHGDHTKPGNTEGNTHTKAGSDGETNTGNVGGKSGSSGAPNEGGVKSGGDGGTKSGGDGSSKAGGDGGTKSGGDGSTKAGGDGGTKSGGDSGPKSGGDTSTTPGDSNTGSDSNDPKYADTPVKRGRTIYRNDFNGAKGEHPDENVFDTQHIGPDGLTRQRGASIHEDAIVSSNNTVEDGNGNLQLFAKKQSTLDPVTGETVDYTKGSFNTGKDKADNEHGLTFNLKDYPNGIVIETRAMHPKDPGTKFDALWIMTDRWAADPSKGEKKKDTIEYDAAEGGGAGITVHYPVKDSNGKSVDNYGGGAHPDLEDGKFHTYTVAISHNGDVTEYIDGKQAFSKKDVFPTDKDLHLRASLEVSPKWTGKKYIGNGGMSSDGAGYIDYLDVSEMKS